MVSWNDPPWSVLEAGARPLLLLGAVLVLVFAVLNGVVYAVDAFPYPRGFSLVLLVSRLAILLGVAGLSMQVARRDVGSATVAWGVLSLAVLFTLALLVVETMAVLEVGSGVDDEMLTVGALLLTVLTFVVFGILSIRTGAFPFRIGGLFIAAGVVLVAETVTLLLTWSRLAGAVWESALFAIFASIWYLLRGGIELGYHPESSPEA